MKQCSNNNQNNVQLMGQLVTVKEVWRSSEHVVYEGVLNVVRNAYNTLDFITILFSDKEFNPNDFVAIKGQFRSRDLDNNGKLKVDLYVYAKEIDKLDRVEYLNEISLSGYVCKKPTLRNTPSGKTISDLLIACNYGKEKTAYLPVIVWGRDARKVSKSTVGTYIDIKGKV